MTARIAARIAAAHTNGMTIADAFDFVLGAGAYDRFVDDLYTQLRAGAVS